MKRISEEELKALESCCDFAWDTFKYGYKMPRNPIFDNLKRSLRFKRDYKIEDNFAYIYYKVSNFDKILDGRVKVLRENEEISLVEYNQELNYIKYYKLLIDDDFIVNLELSQTFKQIYFGCQGKFEFELPIFICENLSVFVIQNGIEYQILEKVYEIEEMNYINSSFFRNISKSLFFNMEVLREKEGDLEIYYDENLVEKVKTINVNRQIDIYLNEQLALGNITSDDLEFNKKIIRKKAEENIITSVNFKFNSKYGKFCTNKKSIQVKCWAKRIVYELTNNSKVKFIVTKYKTDFKNKLVSLDYLISKILKPNLKELDIKTIYTRRVINLYVNSKPLKEKHFIFDSDQFIFYLKKYNNIFLPRKVVSIDKRKTATTLAEFIKKDEESGQIYLTQYLYLKNESKILRLVYQIISASFSFGTTKLENVVIPEVICEKCCLILLDEDFDLDNITQNIFKIDDLQIKAKESEVLSNIFEQTFGSNKYTSYTLIKDCNIFGEEKKITFLEEQKVKFHDLVIIKEYNDNLTKEQLDSLLEYYKNKKKYIDMM